MVAVADHRDSVRVIVSDAMAAQKDEQVVGRARVVAGRARMAVERARVVVKVPVLGEEAIEICLRLGYPAKAIRSTQRTQCYHTPQPECPFFQRLPLSWKTSSPCKIFGAAINPSLCQTSSRNQHTSVRFQTSSLSFF